VKPFSFSKLSLVLLGFGGALIFAPQTRAQSEIAPDHFDGTDSWAAAAAAKVPAPKTKAHTATATSQAPKKPTAPSLQPVAAREVVADRRSAATAADKKRKTAAQKSDN
jgi:hypothetical protein